MAECAGMVALIAIPAAMLLGIGFVLQQQVAARAPAQDALSWRLLRDVIGKRRWLAGISAMVAGQVLGAIALGAASITIVEPLLTANLLFALGLARLVSGQSLRRREWLGALVLAAGLAVFVIAAGTRPGPGPDSSRQALFVGVAVAFCALITLGSRTLVPERRAVALSVAAGSLYGLQDGFTRQAVQALGHGPLALLATWTPYAVLAVAVPGLLLAQSAFEMAPLRVSLPAVSLAEPTVGIIYGTVVTGDILRTGTTWTVVRAVALAAAAAGCLVVTRSTALCHTAAAAAPERREARTEPPELAPSDPT